MTFQYGHVPLKLISSQCSHFGGTVLAGIVDNTPHEVIVLCSNISWAKQVAAV